MKARRIRPHASWALVALLAIVLAGCAIEGDTGEIPQNVLDPAPGTIAQELDALWNRVFPIAVAVFILVQAAIIFVVFRFRARSNDEGLPKQIAGNTRLEILWTVIPAVILLGFVAPPTVRTIFNLAIEDEEAMNVRVIAKQYWWEFEYEDPEQQGVTTANELRIPTGREIQLDMQAVSATISYDPARLPEGQVEPRGEVAVGVIHSFWPPELAGKQDVVPGHTREMALTAEEPGVYFGQCAEFCGLSHANMRFTVIAMEPDAFDGWIEEQAQPAEIVDEGLAAEGQEAFATQGCVACHAIDGFPTDGVPTGEPIPEGEQARVGPNLTHWNSRELFAGILENRDDQQVRDWLRNPQAQKPGAQMPNLNLSEETIDALVAYLRTLD